MEEKVLFLIYATLIYVVQPPSHVWLFTTPWTAAHQASLSLIISWSGPSSSSLSQWCHLAISFSDALFSFCPQSFSASGTFAMSLLLASDDQNTGTSASTSVIPVNIQSWSPLRLTGLITLLSKGLSGVFPVPQFKGISSLMSCLLYSPALTTVHDHWKDHSLDYTDLCQQSNVWLFNTLSRFFITFLSRNNHLLISWLQSPSAVILEPKKRKSVTTSTFSPSICHAVMGLDATILVS